MSLAITKQGHQLLSFDLSEALILPSDINEVPLPLALVVAQHKGKVLFIYNTWRKEWELPGGMIDEGETAEEVARRELTEETAQIASALRFIGLAKMRLQPDDRFEYGAIYFCELEEVEAFQENDEANQIVWSDLSEPFEGEISAIDWKLAELTIESLST